MAAIETITLVKGTGQSAETLVVNKGQEASYIKSGFKVATAKGASPKSAPSKKARKTGS